MNTEKLQKRMQFLQKMKRETPWPESVQVSIDNIAAKLRIPTSTIKADEPSK